MDAARTGRDRLVCSKKAHQLLTRVRLIGFGMMVGERISEWVAAFEESSSSEPPSYGLGLSSLFSLTAESQIGFSISISYLQLLVFARMPFAKITA